MLTTMKLKHVQRIEAPESKGGGVYYYFRPTGEKFTAKFGTAEFIAEHKKFMDARAARAADAERPGTLGALIALYKTKPEFKLLAPDTKSGYQRVFDRLRKVGPIALPTIDQPVILGWRDKTFDKHGRWLANYVVKVLSAVFKWAIPHGHMAINPAQGVPKIRKPKRKKIANRPWTPAEFHIVTTRASTAVRTAIYLGSDAMLRITDCLAVEWDQYDGKALHKIISKNGRDVAILATTRLRRQLEQMRSEIIRRRKLPRDTVLTGPIVQSRHGKGYTRSGMQTNLYKLIRTLEAQGLVNPGLTHHGLRKGMATYMAEELEIDGKRIAAAMGETEEATRIYTEPADQKRMSRQAFTVLESKLASEEEGS